MNNRDEEKLILIGIGIVIMIVIFSGGVGYIALFTDVFFDDVKLSPGGTPDDECIGDRKVNCFYESDVLDGLLCNC